LIRNDPKLGQGLTLEGRCLYLSCPTWTNHWDKHNLFQWDRQIGTSCGCPSGTSTTCPNLDWERSKETSPCPMGQVISPRWRSFLVPGQPLYPRWKVSQFIFILQPHPNLHPFILRVWFNTCLFVGIPGLFSVSGMFKIFVGKNCRICQLYWYLNQAICSKTRQRDL